MKKKIRIAVIVFAVLLAAGTAVWFGSKKMKKTTVLVYSMEELSQPIWEESTNLEGMVTSHTSQEVKLLDNQIVSKVHVQEGQEVKEGDALLSYDMTLADIDLEMEKLNKQQLEIRKKGLEQELKGLKRDKSKLAVQPGSYKLDYFDGRKEVWQVTETTAPDGEPPLEQEPPVPEGPQESEETPPLEVPEEPDVPSEVPEEPEVPSEVPEEPDIPSAAPEGPEETPPSEPEIPQPSGAYKRLYGEVSLEAEDFTEEGTIIENAIPYKGKGTREEPFVFLCKKGVLIQGAFLNKIAGFDVDSEGKQAAVFCELEVRSEDSTEGTLLFAMRLPGPLIREPVPADKWFRTMLGETLAEIMPPKEELPEAGEISELPEGAGEMFTQEEIIGGYSKEELEKAIDEKEREIVTAGLDIREADLRIKKVQQELQEETVRSSLNGVVKKVGDPMKGELDGKPFIVVESSGGVYVEGRVAEDMLGEIKQGQRLSGFAYESGMPFEAEVKEVSPYPVNNYYVYSDREISYYPFTAFIQNSEGLKDHEMVSMNMPQTEGEVTGIFVSKEYVRNKDGEDFVYKEGSDGRLQKQVVKTGRTFYGSLVEIKDGITKEDYLAFPYGKKVKEGVKVKHSTMAELYNMY